MLYLEMRLIYLLHSSLERTKPGLISRVSFHHNIPSSFMVFVVSVSQILSLKPLVAIP